MIIRILKRTLKNLLYYRADTKISLLILSLSFSLFFLLNAFFQGSEDAVFKEAIKQNGHISILSKRFLKKEKLLSPQLNIENTEEIITSLNEIDTVKSTHKASDFYANVLNEERYKNIEIRVRAIECSKADFVFLNDEFYGYDFSSNENYFFLESETAKRISAAKGDTLKIFFSDIEGKISAKALKLNGIFTQKSERTKIKAYISFSMFEKIIKTENAQKILCVLKDPSKVRACAKEIRKLKCIKEGSHKVLTFRDLDALKIIVPILSTTSSSVTFLLFLTIFFQLAYSLFIYTAKTETAISDLNKNLRSKFLIISMYFEKVMLTISSLIIALIISQIITYLFFQNTFTIAKETIDALPFPTENRFYLKISISSFLKALAAAVFFPALSEAFFLINIHIKKKTS